MEQLTLDQFGRVEIPEKIRQQLGINNETKLSLEVENGQLILKPVKSEVETYYEDGILVFKAEPVGITETATHQQRAVAFREWAESHRGMNLPHLSDYAVSRESIYDDDRLSASLLIQTSYCAVL